MLTVTPDNFIRAETDMYFGNLVADRGFARFGHDREFIPLDRQLVVRQNRDTFYSAGVFDLASAPLTVTLPDAGDRFMSLQVISQDHYVPEVVYGSGTYTFTRDSVGTRYVLIAIRILVNPDDPADVAAVHRLQDSIITTQDDIGVFEVPEWDAVSQAKVRAPLIALAATLPDTRGAFGTVADTEPVRRLICSASAWGGNPEKDALYLNVNPDHNDGATEYRLTVRDVPVDGFWSVTVYNADGYFTPNAQNAYSLNNLTAQREGDGSVVVHFGGRDGTRPNCLPVTPGWNYLVRLYRPRPQILDGSWTFPQPQPV